MVLSTALHLWKTYDTSRLGLFYFRLTGETWLCPTHWQQTLKSCLLGSSPAEYTTACLLKVEHVADLVLCISLAVICKCHIEDGGAPFSLLLNFTYSVWHFLSLWLFHSIFAMTDITPLSHTWAGFYLPAASCGTSNSVTEFCFWR